MSLKKFCKDCPQKVHCDESEFRCNALSEIYKIVAEEDRQRKRELIIELGKFLNAIECEVSKELEELGKKVIAKFPELSIIKTFDIRVGYVISYKSKKSDGKTVGADCQKVTGSYKAYLPYDFVITFYEPNIHYMTDNQKKVLMLHELKHIGIGPKGLRIVPHDIEDFSDLLLRYGLQWNHYNNDIVDILAGGDIDQETASKKEKKKQRKR